MSIESTELRFEDEDGDERMIQLDHDLCMCTFGFCNGFTLSLDGEEVLSSDSPDLYDAISLLIEAAANKPQDT